MEMRVQYKILFVTAPLIKQTSLKLNYSPRITTSLHTYNIPSLDLGLLFLLFFLIFSAFSHEKTGTRWFGGGAEDAQAKKYKA
jgi:hypothetical protein